MMSNDLGGGAGKGGGTGGSIRFQFCYYDQCVYRVMSDFWVPLLNTTVHYMELRLP